jgi:uncharacterized LabA/DUF88 family protein
VKVGVYVDGFNLYYGARSMCGRGTAGWRWLDIRALASSLLPSSWVLGNATIDRVVYCTARIGAASNPSGHADQDVYLKALKATGSVDEIEHGTYVSRVRRAPLATPDRRGRPVLTTSDWPVMVQDDSAKPVPGARFMVSVAHREEKGSDVNVAAHLLTDTLTSQIDAAMVISNDSDLRLPIQQARLRIPVGTVNPTRSFQAGDLKGRPTDGVGNHWWRQLVPGDLTAHQLPDPAGAYIRPPDW